MNESTNWLDQTESSVTFGETERQFGNESASERYFSAPRHSRSLWGKESKMNQIEIGIPPTALFLNSLFLKDSKEESFGLISDEKGIFFFDNSSFISSPSPSNSSRHLSSIKACKWSKEGSFLVLACETSLNLFKIEEEKSFLIGEILLHYNPKDVDVGFIQKEEGSEYLIAVAGPNGAELFQLDSSLAENLSSFSSSPLLLHESSNIAIVSFSPCYRSLAIASLDGHISVWNIDKLVKEKVRDFWYDFLDVDRISSVSFSFDSNCLACGTWGGAIQIFKRDDSTWVKANPKYKSYTNPSNFSTKTSIPPVLVSFSPNNRFIVFTSKGNTVINICEISTGYLLDSILVNSPIKGLLVVNEMLVIYNRNREIQFIDLHSESILNSQDKFTFYSNSIGEMKAYYEGLNPHLQFNWKEDSTSLDLIASNLFSNSYMEFLFNQRKSIRANQTGLIEMNENYAAFADEGTVRVFSKLDRKWKTIILSQTPQKISIFTSDEKLTKCSFLSISCSNSSFFVNLETFKASSEKIN